MRTNLQQVLLGVAVGAIALPAAGAAPQLATVHVQAQIDGRSRLELAGDTATWQHFERAAPGRHLCDVSATALPTLLDGVSWYPVWPDVPTCENRDCGGCTSDVFSGSPAPLPAGPFTANVVVHGARGAVMVVEQPSAANGYRVVVEFDDLTWPDAEWYDVTVEAQAMTPGVVRYCTSVPNTTGSPAWIDLVGSRSVTGNDTRLLTSDCPPGHAAVFLCGTAPAWIPFANGVLCISPFSPGIMRLGPVEVVRFDGTIDHPLDMQALAPLGGVHAGSALYFQAWFRDHPAGGYPANLTDAIEVQFVQ